MLTELFTAVLPPGIQSETLEVGVVPCVDARACVCAVAQCRVGPVVPIDPSIWRRARERPNLYAVGACHKTEEVSAGLSLAYDSDRGLVRIPMPNDKTLPATIAANSTLPQAQSSGLVARGLFAVQQSLAVADKDDAESLFKKGMLFRNGENGTPRDDDKAREHLLAAAKLNHAGAQFELCILLGEYDEWPDAVGWLEKSVSLGFGPAQRYLADGLSEPLVAEHLSNSAYSESKLYRQASAWYEERASAGDADAQYDFAFWLNHPDSPIHSHVKAMHWMRAAAQQDHGFACIRLGEWLLEEKEGDRSTEQGIYWLSRAANLGKSHACRLLGDLYLLGHTGGNRARGRVSQIVAPDKRAAVSWYERQIELEKDRDSFMGAHSLARLYLFGDHLDQNLGHVDKLLTQMRAAAM